MPKIIVLILLSLFIGYHSPAQQSGPQDDLALKIPKAGTYSTAGISAYINDHFSTDTARIRAIYVWVANNVDYDVAKLRARTGSIGGVKQPVDDVLKKRTAVCQGYADLFAELCAQCGIKAMVIGGYTKQRGAVSSLPHAWVGAQMGGAWYLFDPTWGAGYVKEDGFVRGFNNTWYKLPPAEMIKDHMPFDPMFQLLNYTITNKEFTEGKTGINTAKPFFNYTDTLQLYNGLTAGDKLKAEARRLEKNGVQNDLILERLNYLKKGTQIYASKDGYDEAGVAYKQAIALFNQYIDHKNKQFATLKEDVEIKGMMDSIGYYLSQSRALLIAVVARDEAHRQFLAATNSSIERFQKRVAEEQEFVGRYLSADKATRKSLFARK